MRVRVPHINTASAHAWGTCAVLHPNPIDCGFCHVFHRTEGALGESETNQHAPAGATVLVAAPAAALTLATVPRTPSAMWLLAPPRAAWCANTLSRQCLRAQS
jgi:hypothetical protein